jgi:hypothetical protein
MPSSKTIRAWSLGHARLGRRAAVASFALLAWACAHTERVVETQVIDRVACCAVREGGDLESERAACAARGCSWQRELLCMGVPMPDDMEEEYAAERDRCELPCDCVCTADLEACARVP